MKKSRLQVIFYLLHVIPVCDDAMFNGVSQGKDISLTLSFISYVAVLISPTPLMMSWTAKHAGEYNLGGIMTTISSFAFTCAVVYHYR